MPCNYRHDENEIVSEECNSDVKAQQEYLGTVLYSAILVNDDVFDPQKFQSESVIRESKIVWSLIQKDTPSLFVFPFQSKILHDETDLL